jgi:hypothetical protein
MIGHEQAVRDARMTWQMPRRVEPSVQPLAEH